MGKALLHVGQPPGPRAAKSDRRWALAAAAVTAAAALTFYLVSCLRYASYHTLSFDLALYVRHLWGIRRGDLVSPLVDHHLLSLHAEPILWPLAWLTAVLPTVETLLLLQAVALAAPGLILYRAYLRAADPADAGRKPVALCLCAASVLAPLPGHLADFDFHPITLAVPLLLLGCLKLWPPPGAPGPAGPREQRSDALSGQAQRQGHRDRLLAASYLLLALACREDVALVVAVVLGLCALQAAAVPGPLRGRAAAAAWPSLGALAAVAYFVLYWLVVRPHFGVEKSSLAMHFPDLGDTPQTIALAVRRRPWLLLSHLDQHHLVFLAQLLLPLALLPLLAPRLLLPALPPLSLLLIDRLPEAASLRLSHYPTLLLPFLLLATLQGLLRLRGRRWAGPLLLGAAALGHLLWGASPLSLTCHRDELRDGPHTAHAAALAAACPADLPVSMPIEITPHVAERADLRVAPTVGQRTEVVVLSTRIISILGRSIVSQLERSFARVGAQGPYLLMRRRAAPPQGVERPAR